jgi:hypothetical protein
MWLDGRNREVDLSPVGSQRQRFASHQFDRRPVLVKNVCCVMVIVRFDTNAAGLPSGTVRYLKVKIEADCFGILFDRLIIAAHLVSPRFALRHFNFLIRIFVRHDYGALERARSPIFASDLRSLGGIIGVIAVRDAPFGEEVQRFENPAARSPSLCFI